MTAPVRTSDLTHAVPVDGRGHRTAETTAVDTVGSATTDERGNTVYRDNMARTTGRSVTSGGTTIIYDQMGRQVGTITKGR